MIDSAAQSKSFGFENLMLQGWKDQLKASAEALREGRGARPGSNELSAEERRRVDELKATDRKVRAHEQAHIAVGGDLVRGSAFSYETGPDKRRYAVAGEVSIDTSKGRTPEETIPKAAHIRDTALAPADPSPQDRQVAAQATQMEMQARQELAQQAAEERARAGNGRGGQVVGAYQAAGGLERSTGFSAEA